MTIQNWALLKDNVVINCVVFDDPSEELMEIVKTEKGGDAWHLIPEGTVTVTGATLENGHLIPPKPFDSWILALEGPLGPEWFPPFPPPFDDENPMKKYRWNEDIVDWEPAD